ncbi:unnamed protein product, partial [Candidula unifasciata]
FVHTVQVLNCVENMEGDPEAEMFSIEVKKLVLPDGSTRTDVLLDTERTVRAEKERILREAEIPYPILYVMTVHGPNRSREVLEDSKFVEAYAEILAGGAEYVIHIEKKSSQVERPPRAVNPQLFNISLK